MSGALVTGVQTCSLPIAARTWPYIAHRSDWLANPADMAARTRALEEKLSDALHERLTQRFVDRRTAVLLREIGQGAGHLPVDVEESGSVLRSEEHTSELQPLMRISYAVFCLKKKKSQKYHTANNVTTIK